ncbi:MAG: hypothetical protein PHR43_06975 [Dehalococcoidales bacterium]|nr:hypothetical protein [Dehalococcoidales bacterium]
MAKDKLTKQVIDFSREKGADLVGIASVDRFEHAPEHHHPRYFLPGAKSVVVVAMEIALGPLQNVAAGKENLSYCGFGVKFVNAELDRIAYELAKFLERRCYSAYPIPANAPRDPMFRWGLSHRHAALAAGMGEMGTNQILLTPQFGPRQKLVSIITEAPLEPDPLVKHEICDHCQSCVKICPSGALSADRVDTAEIGGMTFEYGHQTKWKCIFGCGGLISKGTFAATDFTMPEMRPDTEQMFDYFAHLDRKQDFLEHETGSKIPWCARCLAVCALHHDAKRKKNKRRE